MILNKIRFVISTFLLCPLIVLSQNSLVRQENGSLKLVKIANSKPRNVVFIIIDDQRYDAMGFLKSQPFISTPNIDLMAKGVPIFKMLLLPLHYVLLRGPLFLPDFMLINTLWQIIITLFQRILFFIRNTCKTQVMRLH